jgi:hypothetical protein
MYLRSNNYISMRGNMFKELRVKAGAEIEAMKKQDDRVFTTCSWCNN